MGPRPHCSRCEASLVDELCPRCAFTAALFSLPPAATAESNTDRDPSAVDGFELIHELGRGASAVVWLARERGLNRLVALKLIHSGADPRLRDRLRREAQAVAQLRHPHIVPVHALCVAPAGSGLVMQYLEGGDLRTRLAGRPLSPVDAAQLARKVAGGLDHAHRAGILHRDIKPSNVLLDADGEPRLADFGLAATLDGTSDLTSPGQVAGTAAYLAPELATGVDRASTASDIYSLGALLYECIAGRAPFVGDTSAAILAQVAHAEPPAPRLLQPGIPRDLETICVKCLQRNPAHRYRSAGEVGDDLGRFLRGEIIKAKPAHPVVKVARWCRRHRSVATLAGIACVLLLTLAIGGPIAAVHLGRAREAAARETAASKAVSEFLGEDLLAQASPRHQPDRDMKLRTVLDRAAEKIEHRFEHQPLVAASLRRILGETYGSLGEHEAALQQFEQALEVHARELGPSSVEALATRSRIASSMLKLGRYADAETFARTTADRLRASLGPDHPETLRSLYTMAEAFELRGRLPEAIVLHTDVLERRTRALGVDHADVWESQAGLAVAFRRAGRLGDAEALNLELLDSRRRILGHEHPDTLATLGNLAIVYQFQDRFAAAESVQRPLLAIQERVLGGDHPATLSVRGALAASLQFQGRLHEALNLHLETLEAKSQALGDAHPSTLTTMNSLALTYHFLGDHAAAEDLARRALDTISTSVGADSPELIPSMNNLATALSAQGKLSEAETLHDRSWAIAKHAFSDAHPIALEAMDHLGRLHLQQRRVQDAVALLSDALLLREKIAASNWRTEATRSALGEAMLEAGDLIAAEALLTTSAERLIAQGSAIPAVYRVRELTRAKERLVRFYRERNDAVSAQSWSDRFGSAVSPR